MNQGFEKKPANFRGNTKVCVTLSKTLRVLISGGAGRAKDKSEDAFGYVKLTFEQVDPNSGAATPLATYSLGRFETAQDFAARLGATIQSVTASMKELQGKDPWQSYQEPAPKEPEYE